MENIDHILDQGSATPPAILATVRSPWDKKKIKKRLKIVQKEIEYYLKVENINLNIPVYQKYLFYNK